MFTAFKCTKTILKNVRFKNLLIPYCYFSDEAKGFVKRVKALDKLKGNFTLPQSSYEKGKYIIFLKSELVLLERNNELVFKDFKDVEDLKKFGDVTTVFLNMSDSCSEVYLFAADLGTEPDADVKNLENNFSGKFVTLRSSLSFLGNKQAQAVTHAKGLLNFCKTYKFCYYCGGNLKIREGGFQKECTNCKIVHYPQVAPIGITLIEDENHEEVLLVRQERHPPGMYTCVAGFIEPGESLEENVMREVAEEVGVAVSNVRYCVSQHWALPSSQLILGCIATAVFKSVEKDDKEIVDAKWVTAEELKDAVTRVRQRSSEKMNGDKLLAPNCNAVSHCLMVKWLRQYHNYEPPES